MNQELEENEILQLFKEGGSNAEKAFNTIASQYGDILYRQIRAMTRNHECTNDVLQNVFIKIYQNLSKFKGDSSLYTWIYRIARNETLNFLEKEKRRVGVDLDEPVMEILAGHYSLDGISEEKITSWLLEAINDLPEKQAVVFQLKYFEDLKYSEISKKLSTSEGALKANYHHARQKIEEFLINKLNH